MQNRSNPKPLKIEPVMPPDEPPEQMMDAFDPEERLPLAACALMVEMASIDNEFDESERKHILDALRRHFTLSETDAQELLELAEEVRDESSDIWAFTNLLNQECSREEKVGIIEEIWRLVYADGHFHHHEDFLAHQMGKLMNLPHPEVIEAKLRARDAGTG